MKKLLQKLSVLFLAIIFISSLARAVENDEAQLRKDLPKLLGSSNEGTEFFMTFHPGWETAGEVNSCKIYITSAVYTEVTVEIPGKKVLIKRTTNPNDVIEISLDPDVAQCYRKTDLEIPQSQKVYKGYGVIVTAKDPIICYGMTCFASITDGYLAYPKSVLGKKYVVSSYNSPFEDSWKQHLTSYTSIVGVYNNTIVNVKLGGSFSNFTPLPFTMKTGDTRQDTLNRGDVWLIGTMGDYNDVTGTTVDANKPVSVISGSFSALVPLQIGNCNFLIEQDLPMENWGYKYHVAPIIRRTAPSIIRIFTSEPNTTIYRDDNEWSYIKTVGGKEGEGFVERRTAGYGDSIRPITISAKNRIAVTQYNTGQSDDGFEGEPFQMALVPLEQYQKSFVFCTPRKNDGTKFENNYLNLYYKSTIDGKIPDDLEFGTANYGVFNWKKLNTIITSQGKVFIDNSITDSRNYRLAQIELDAFSGVYAIRGNDPMMGNIYGFETSNSYGYLVSAGFRDLSKPDAWAPIPTFTIDCKGNIQGKVIEQPENNELLRSNLQEVRLVRSESSNFKDLVYDEANYIPGTSYIMNWSLGVMDQESDGKAVISFSDRAGNDTTITIDYQRTKFTIKLINGFWGRKRKYDPPDIRDFTLTNDSQNPIVLDSIFLLSTVKARKWGYNGFTLDSSIYKKYGGVLPGYSMQPGESLPFKVKFNPMSINSEYLTGKTLFSDSIGIKANKQNGTAGYCYFKYKYEVQATIYSPCINVENIDFGQEIVGNSVTQSFLITNTGPSALNITGYTWSSGEKSAIYETNLGVVNNSNNVIIKAGANKKYNVTFKPNAVGQFPDKIDFKSDADTTRADYNPTLNLTGEGIELTISDVPDLNMDENTTANVPFSINSDNSSSITFIKESDDEILFPTANMIITGIGNTCNINITPVQNKTGSCNLTITATNNVVSASTKFKVTVRKPGSVYENSDISDITIVPNPVNSHFSIMSKSCIIGEVEIYNVLGILELKTDNCYDIDISNLTAGIYYCIIKSENNYYTRKLELVK